MRYKAKVLRINGDVEEEVLLQIGKWKILCFAGICPYQIHEGMEYFVDISFVVLDDYDVKELTEISPPAIANSGKGFSTELVGRLEGSRLCLGELEFSDEIFLSDYGYLDGKFVSVRVDRISAEFID